MSWEKLRETYAQDGIFLALGAGVSVDCQLPTWRDLLQRLVSLQLDIGDDNLFKDFLNHGLSLPIIASLLEVRSSDRSEFIERVREALYRDFPYFPDGITKSNRRRFVQYIQETNPTLRSVASLCAMRAENRRTYTANKRIQAIVTFNLDALLQAYVYARYEKRLLRTIERPSASRRPEKINVYHMHGFLRFDSKAGDTTKEAPDAAVLTEQDYFDFFNEPTSLFNYTFLYLLREFSCLFIGLSMQDDNIRRLLHYSKKERLGAFRREGETSVSGEKLLRHYTVLKRSGIVHVDKAIEDTLDPLGTRVLWVDDYEEIPAQIEGVYRSADGNWDAVYA
jgi:hypothetical protein